MSDKAKSIESKKTSGQDERLKEVSKLRLLLNRPELGAVGGAILVFIFFGIVAGDTGMFSAYGTLNFLDVSANLGIIAIAAAIAIFGQYMRYGTMPAGVVMTGPGFVTPDNAAKVIKWAAQGYR